MRYYSRAEELQKCCINCLRCDSYTVTTASVYYCSARRMYINPSGCCTLYQPKNGYGAKIDEDNIK